MNKIAIFGGGTIIGAALIVVLPEACSILINAQDKLDHMDGLIQTEIVSHKVMRIIGASIALGFSLMMTIDELFKIIKQWQISKAVEAANQSVLAGNMSASDISQLAVMTPMTTKERREEKQKTSAMLTTVALCVHSLAEGVAMGSSLYRKYPAFNTIFTDSNSMKSF